MLQSLHVKNLALIDETEVEFREGLNILSGETGAGKSIIIGSINLALGEKIPKEMVRNPEKSAFVELIFHVEKEKIKKQLLDFGVELEENQVVLSRKITGGRTISRINGETVSVSRMKEISSLLIDIHGQHEHQSLLAKRKHLDILDNYAKKKLGNKKTGLAEAYQNYRTCKEEWEHSNLNIEERRREFSFLEYEVKEIEQAHLSVGEDEQLEGDYRRFLNGKKIMEAAGSAYAGIAGDSGSASERIGYALK